MSRKRSPDPPPPGSIDDAPRRRVARPAAKPNRGGAGEDAEGLRALSTRVKTAKGRKISSTRWLERQLNDPYVARARAAGYRSRAAFKLRELDEKCRLMRPGGRVVDLGCAPGGWLQVAVKAVAAPDRGRAVGIDLLAAEPVAGAEILALDFLDPSAPARLRAAIGGRAQLVASDMAAPATGHRQTDHLKIMALCEAALDFAESVLDPGGAFVCKMLRGGAEKPLLDRLKRGFKNVRHVKPEASRADSAEIYLVASGFRGVARDAAG